MGVATFVEKGHGSAYVSQHIYGAWWFTALWALLAAVATAYFLRRHVRRASAVALHLSFLIILAGALLTHLTAWSGRIHIRHGETVRTCFVQHGDDIRERSLPFSIALQDFQIRYHEGTTAPADYVTRFVINDRGGRTEAEVSMNHIYTHGRLRLTQSSYDPDLQGSILSVNSDPWGIPVTYAGYALLFISLVWMLLDPKGQYRQLLRSIAPRPGATGGLAAALLSAFLCLPSSALALNTLPQQTAEKLGRLHIHYNGRICPLQTYALDVTRKLTGKTHYGDYSAEQLLAGFLFYSEDWEHEPLIRVKSSALCRHFGLQKRAAFADFFQGADDDYLLGPLVMESMAGNHDKLHQDASKLDDRLMTVVDLQQGTTFHIFPVPVTTADGSTTTRWCSPVDELPASLEEGQSTFIQNAFALLYEQILTGDWAQVDRFLDKLLAYQQKYGADTLPTDTQVQAERLYNRVPFATILFMVCLTMAFLSLWQRRWMQRLALTVLVLSLLALTLCMALRWIISGTIPMSNGYETMLLMAWMVMLVALFLRRRFPIILTFGLLAAGFFLLVSHISQMDPKIGRLMPVLASPLLTVHVSIIMMAYALLSITFLCGIAYFVGNTARHKQPLQPQELPPTEGPRGATSLYLLSQVFLYPAMTCLGLGIFIGAIWANVSWGTYWSWDPKETWALITFMVYAVALHPRSLAWLRRPAAYHAYMVLAFLTILMTYFGVNYFLGGMHSYA